MATEYAEAAIILAVVAVWMVWVEWQNRRQARWEAYLNYVAPDFDVWDLECE